MLKEVNKGKYKRNRQTDVAEKNGEEDETVRSANHNNGQIHAEVEDLEELGMRSGENCDADYFCKSDSAKN